MYLGGSELTREASRLGSTTARLKLKGIDGKAHNQGSMWFNSIQSDRPYPDLTYYRLFLWKHGEIQRKKDDNTAAAWLSSARAVGCRLKCRNERNPYSVLNIHRRLLRRLSERKEGMTSSQHGAYIWGHTHPTMDRNNGLPSRKAELIPTKRSSVQIGG